MVAVQGARQATKDAEQATEEAKRREEEAAARAAAEIQAMRDASNRGEDEKSEKIREMGRMMEQQKQEMQPFVLKVRWCGCSCPCGGCY